MLTVMRSLTISSRSARCDSWEGRSQLVLRHGGLRLCGRVPRNGGELDEHVHEGEPHRDLEKNDVRVTARGPVSLVKHTRLLVPPVHRTSRVPNQSKRVSQSVSHR